MEDARFETGTTASWSQMLFHWATTLSSQRTNHIFDQWAITSPTEWATHYLLWAVTTSTSELLHYTPLNHIISDQWPTHLISSTEPPHLLPMSYSSLQLSHHISDQWATHLFQWATTSPANELLISSTEQLTVSSPLSLHMIRPMSYSSPPLSNLLYLLH